MEKLRIFTGIAQCSEAANAAAGVNDEEFRRGLDECRDGSRVLIGKAREACSRFHDARFAQVAAHNRARKRCDHFMLDIDRVAAQERVDASADGAHRSVSAAEVFTDRLHFQVIGYANALEADAASGCVPAQQLHCLRAHGRRRALVDRIEDDMRRHHARNSRAHRGFEGHEFELLQALKIVRESGKMKVRIAVGVAVAWEVLGARSDFALEASDDRAAELRHDGCVARERSLADHRVRWIRIQVSHKSGTAPAHEIRPGFSGR